MNNHRDRAGALRIAARAFHRSDDRTAILNSGDRGLLHQLATTVQGLVAELDANDTDTARLLWFAHECGTDLTIAGVDVCERACMIALDRGASEEEEPTDFDYLDALREALDAGIASEATDTTKAVNIMEEQEHPA